MIKLSLFSLLALLLPAQEPPRPSNPNTTLKSPEVLSDKRIVFRLYAPKAQEVAIGGDWVSQGRGTAGKLEKDDQGIWSITVGPLVPDFYTYNFTVDGVRVLDPKNVDIKPGVTSLSNMFEIPGDPENYEATRPVPHGIISIVSYESKALGVTRSMRVYTPPGYEGSSTRYPVFYLLHGSGDDDAGWSTVGRAGFILDNLIAAGKAKPMIVVMPNGSMPRGQGNPQELFADEFLHSVMPCVESHFRVASGRENRALAGLSMGGGQTLRVGPVNLDKFAYLGVFSSGIREGSDTEKNLAAFLSNPTESNKMLKLFWIGVGEKDTTAGAGAHKLIEVLKAHGITYEFHESEGAHTWINWRHYLNDFAPLLFREAATSPSSGSGSR
ncbi:MAG TPA: alpha/beta hydrolase-fold protein [Bryobacteraceae bacterium]|jgi:enterochelin esterase family protein